MKNSKTKKKKVAVKPATAKEIKAELSILKSRLQAILDGCGIIEALEEEDMFGQHYGDLLREDIKSINALTKRVR